MGRREELRSGKAVKLKSGVYGKLNKNDRTLELETGEVLPLSEKAQRELLPENEKSLGVVRKKEEIERGIKESPFGEFGHQFKQSGVVGGVGDWINRFKQTGEEYLQHKQATEEVSSRISNESPYTSAAATASSFVPDLALTRGMSAFKAAPLLTGLSAGSKIIDEPGQVAGEVALSAVGGKLIDKASSFLNKIAARRAASKAMPGMQAEAKAQNLAGELAVKEQNLAEKQSFDALKSKIKSENENLLQQHKLSLNERQNKMIKAKNDYEKLRSERSVSSHFVTEQEKALEKSYKLAEKEYKQSLEKLPELRRKAQAEYSANVVKNAEEIEKVFPKDSKISSSQFSVEDFIEGSIGKESAAATKEGAQASKVLRSIFPEGEILSSKDLSRKYQTLEKAIQQSPEESRAILSSFKQYMGEKIPNILTDNIAYSRVVPSLKKQVEKDVESVIKSMDFTKHPEGGVFKDLEKVNKPLVMSRAKEKVKQLFDGLTTEDFKEKLQNGEIKKYLIDGMKANDIIDKPLERQFNELSEKFALKLEKALAKSEIKAIASDVDASTKLGKKVSKTLGVSPPIAEPQKPQMQPLAAPIAPQPPIYPPPTPPIPAMPSLKQFPNSPIPQSFAPMPEPTLPPAQGIAQGAGDFLEKDLLGGKGIADNPLAKLAGLKYLLGKGALPLEAGYAGLKGLTSPSQAGEVARLSFKQAGIGAIEQMAQKYPSYKDGILLDPMDRRSLTKEIEDDQEIPREQKAIIQSKVNRGNPLKAPL